MEFKSFKDLNEGSRIFFNQAVALLMKRAYAGHFICDHNGDVDLLTRNVTWVYKYQLIPETIISTIEDVFFSELEKHLTIEYQLFTHDLEKEYKQ